ncbi:MAG: hypothetical protein R2856_30740 [Caldilineaceae bacterium]
MDAASPLREEVDCAIGSCRRSRGKETAIKAQLKLADEYESTATPTVHNTKLGFEGELEVKATNNRSYGGKLSIDGTANIEFNAGGTNFINGQEHRGRRQETIGPFDLVSQIKPLAAW